MSEHWFIIESGATTWAVGAVVALDGDESRHAGGARRLRDGDPVTVFDGAGAIGRGRLVERGRAVQLESVEHVAKPARRVEIASAIPKGDRVSTMLDMATQLGLTAFIPLTTRHGVAEANEKAMRRWSRVCVEACKQSRRAWLPMIHGDAVTPHRAVLDAIALGITPLLAEQGGIDLKSAIKGASSASGIRVLIGPEGGFDPEEIDAMRNAGAVSVSLGDHVLRIETAAVAACALMAKLAERK